MLTLKNPREDAARVKDSVINLVGCEGVSNFLEVAPYDSSIRLMNLLFDGVIAINMFLCLFALTGNMTANMRTQSKEVAVLRSMGLRKMRIRLLYLYESFILVTAACTSGVGIGVSVGLTF